MTEEPEDLTFGEAVVKLKIDLFYEVLKQAGFVDGELIDAIAVTSIGAIGLRRAGVPDGVILDAVVTAMHNTKR